MESSKAFAAIALGAVASDGALGRDEAHHLRNQLEYRTPYVGLSDDAMAGLFDDLLAILREQGAEGLIAEAIPALNPPQRETALAMAAELVHSDRVIKASERAFLDTLAQRLELPAGRSEQILEVIEILHRDSLAS
jgi:uncharacterized membrane protein YebE (DUF533 family)